MALSFYQRRFVVIISAVLLLITIGALVLFRDRVKTGVSGACVDASAPDLALRVQDNVRNRDYEAATKVLDALNKCYPEDTIAPEIANRLGTEFETYGDFANYTRARLNCERTKAPNAHGSDPKGLAARIFSAIQKKDRDLIGSYFDCDGGAGEIYEEFEPVLPEAIGQAFVMSTGTPKIVSEHEAAGQYVMVLEGFEELGTIRIILCNRGGDWSWKYLVSGEVREDVPLEEGSWCRKE